jgi:hypothetical protein
VKAMLDFLKRVGIGLLVVVAIPFAIVLLALFAVIALFVFIFMLFKALVLFFSGRSVFDDLAEDTEAKHRLGTLVDATDEVSEKEEKPAEEKAEEPVAKPTPEPPAAEETQKDDHLGKGGAA